MSDSQQAPAATPHGEHAEGHAPAESGEQHEHTAGHHGGHEDHDASPFPPLSSVPASDATPRAVALLEQPAKGTLGDSYSTTIPTAMLFDGKNVLTSSGKQLLGMVANNLRLLPYDVLIHVD